MAASELLLVRHSSHLRTVSEADVAAALTSFEAQRPHKDVHIDTSRFSADVEGGVWDESHGYIRQVATEIRQLADATGASVHYFGLAEIPHVIALGAYLGDERHVQLHDYQRDETWRWPEDRETLPVTTERLPGERVEQAGIAVLRVEISRAVPDASVDEVVGRDRLADVSIRPTQGRLPDYGIVRSIRDVEAVRMAIRRALASITEYRPGVEAIHLFVAAPVSVCFALGQELRLRNSVPAQTYRYRVDGESLRYRDAILLTSSAAEETARPLTDEQVRTAEHVRMVTWQRALTTVLDYAKSLRARSSSLTGAWYARLEGSTYLAEARPYPVLPHLWNVVQFGDKVDPRPYDGEYGHDLRHNTWRLSNRLLLGLHESTQGNEDELENLIRLFLFHEYLHHHHSLTKYTAEEVGKFPNCLERLDYQADLYAVLHQLDLLASRSDGRLDTDVKKKTFLSDQIDLIIRSFWAFEPFANTLDRWQVRRIRRYLNWYWRQVQVQRADNLRTALHVLSRAPSIELAGLEHRVGGRRIYTMLTRLDPSTELALGLVMENERLLRLTQTVTTPLAQLLEAFRTRNHAAIAVFFQHVFEEARAQSGALPSLVT